MPGRLSRLSTLNRYLAAFAFVAFAALLRRLFDPILGTQLPYLFQYLAVLATARYLGLGPAVAGLVLFTAPALYNVFVHSSPLPPTAARFWAGTAGLYTFSIFLIWVLDRQRRMRSELVREEALSAQLRAIVESSEDAIISKDLTGIIQSWNHGAEQIYGYGAAEAIGKPISMLVPPDRLHEESDMIERIRHGGRVTHFETIRMRKDGRPIHLSLTISPIRDPKGNITGASHISRDITEQKEREEQYRQTQKLESLGVLAGGLAHDFNNLLTGVMGNASLAIEDLPADSPAMSRIGEVLSASERAALLVRQMLAYAGKGRFLVEQVNLSKQISEIVPLIRTSMPLNVELDLRLADPLPAVEADPSQMQQLIMNLAINGAEAIGEAHGAVTITTSARTTEAERQVVLEVRDTGCGMDEATRARIFDPFYTTKFTGRGLGLAAVLGIIRGHNGFISVESAPGHGSTFTVALPAAAPREASAAKEPPVDLHGYGHVLVVDDEEVVRGMAKFTLERCGYTVETASDGRQAVELFRDRAGEFDVVLLDLTMPVMSGEEALRGIQAIRRDARVVLSSGFTESEALVRFRDRSLAGFLQKPYTAQVLARKIKEALNQERKVI